MGLFSFLKKRSKPAAKTYPLTQSEVMDVVTDVCSMLKMQFDLLDKCGTAAPSLVTTIHGDKQPVVDRWLTGYLSGFYDAFSQYRGQRFELNALELIFSVLYDEDDAAAAIQEYHVARMTLRSDREAALLFGYEEFEDGMLAGGNNVFDWANKKIEYPLEIYKKYS